MFDLTDLRDKLSVQLSIVIFLLMIGVGAKCYARQEWGKFLGAVVVAILCMGIVVLPAQFEAMAKAIIDMIIP